MRARGTVAATLMVVGVLVGCGAQEEPRDEPTTSPSETQTSSGEPTEAEASPAATPVEVVVVYNNFLDQSCEALSGIYKGLHDGSPVVIETETGEVVGRARLGDPPAGIRTPKSLCAWGATVEAQVEPGTKYLARAATRFTSKPLDGADFTSKRFVINASR